MYHKPEYPQPHHGFTGHAGGSLSLSVLWFPSQSKEGDPQPGACFWSRGGLSGQSSLKPTI